MDEQTLKYMPAMLTGFELDEALKVEPDYDISIRNASEANRLIALQDLYSIYIPTDMSREIYSKLYLSLLRSMNKKQSLTAIRQFSENQNHIKGKEFTSLIGGSDSFTIIGDSGIGKSATVSRVIDMISVQKIIDLPNNMRIIPCIHVQTPADCSIKGLLFEILRKVDEILDTRYHYNAMRINATADMLIGSVSTVALNHIGMLVVDEIQNVVTSKNGTTIPGHPDLWLRKYNTAVFVHGCFWHRHTGCKYSTTPETRKDFWQKKFDNNIRRDRQVKEELKELGIKNLIVWECTVKKMKKERAVENDIITRIYDFINSEDLYLEL